MGLPDLRDARHAVGDADYFVASAGEGPPVLLLHGFPETHVCWHGVAPALAREHAVVAPGPARLRRLAGAAPAGRGARATRSARWPPSSSSLMAALGHERFAVVGHDRGARVAYRLALDQPERVSRLAVINVVPTLEQFERMGAGPRSASGPGSSSPSPRPSPSGCWRPIGRRCSTTSSPPGRRTPAPSCPRPARPMDERSTRKSSRRCAPTTGRASTSTGCTTPRTATLAGASPPRCCSSWARRRPSSRTRPRSGARGRTTSRPPSCRVATSFPRRRRASSPPRWRRSLSA